MWRWRKCRRRLLLGALTWVFTTASGGAGSPLKKVLDEVRLQEADELKQGYERLYLEGKYNEAITLAQRACVILGKEHGRKSVEVAGCLNDLGVLYKTQGVYEKAGPLFQRALAILEKALGPEHPDVATSLINLAGQYRDQGSYEEAELLYERALAIREKVLGPGHPDIAYGLDSLASLYRRRGAYENAEALQERALNILEKAMGPEHPDVAYNLNNLALLYEARGAYEKAESFYERALVILEKALGPEHPNVATGLNNLGALYEVQGVYGMAEPLHKRALVILEKTLGPEHPDVATSLNSLGVLYEAQGAYEKAESLYERALVILENALGPEHPDVATGLNNLAGLYEMRGAHESAEALYKRALVIREKMLGYEHPDVAHSLSSLGSLYYEQGAYGRTKPLFERALAIWENALGPEHPDVAKGLNNLAGLYWAQGVYEGAEALYGRALVIREKTLGQEHPHVAQILSNLASLYYEQHKITFALRLHRRALDIEEGNLVRIMIFANESRRLSYASKLSSSLHYALSIHLRANAEHDTAAKLALTTLLRRKSRVQDLVVQSKAALRHLLRDDHRLLDELTNVDSQIAVLSIRGPGALRLETHSQQLDELRQQRDRLWAKLAEQSALVESLAHPVSIEDVQQTLSAGSVLIELIHYLPKHDDTGTRVLPHEPKPPPRYAAYLVFPDRFDWLDLGPAAPIDEHVKAFRRALQAKQVIPTDLYDAVMHPLVEKLGSAHHLIIAPVGDLSLIPFGALYDGNQYLVERYDLRYITTGRDLLDPPASPPITTTPVAVVTNPTGASLPDAELEADFLTSFFPHSRLLQGDQATETNVRTIERPLVLHFATHGFFGAPHNERDNPMFRSGLYLANIDQVEVDRDHDDGRLTAYEVSGMDLRGTQLVVLSACETGMGTVVRTEGKVLVSEGPFGLRRAFATAGARTTVMSLWEISGVTAQKTMKAYYRKLAEGLGRGEAMQAVQLEMLRTEEHQHPKDWAAFIVSGDDTPMVFPAGQEPRVETPSDQQGPPPIHPRSGCAIAASPDHNSPLLALVSTILGLISRRRRRK